MFSAEARLGGKAGGGSAAGCGPCGGVLDDCEGGQEGAMMFTGEPPNETPTLLYTVDLQRYLAHKKPPPRRTLQ